MGNCSSGPYRQNAFLPALLFVVVTILAGCATSKPRFAATSSSEPSQPAAIQAPQNGSPDATSGAAPEPQPLSADVHPVAYQQSVEEIPALPAPDSVYPLDMSTALALVAGKNPQVAYSQSRIREAYANLQAANVLWLPTIQTGVSYNHHEGNLQDSSGAILDVSRSSLQAGLGAGAVGAGTTTQPGIVAQFHLVDALFQPKIAERNVWALQHASDAVLNDQLLEAAVAYQ